MVDEWQPVPVSQRSAWRTVINPWADKAVVFVPEPCPFCGSGSLRQFEVIYGRTHPGWHRPDLPWRGIRWDWCASCRMWDWADGLISEDWRSLSDSLPGGPPRNPGGIAQVDAGVRELFGVGDLNP